MFKIIASDGLQSATLDVGPITMPEAVGQPAPPAATGSPRPAVQP